MVFFASLVLLVFYDLLSLICSFVYVCCKALPLWLWFHIVVIGFHDLLVVCFLTFLLCFESWELVGKEES